MNYQDLLDTLTNVGGENAPVESKKNALHTVATALKGAQEPDAMVRLKASLTLSSLKQAPPGANMDVRLGEYVSLLKRKVAAMNVPAGADDVEMAMGGRKRRRGKKTAKKTRSKNKKTRRSK